MRKMNYKGKFLTSWMTKKKFFRDGNANILNVQKESPRGIYAIVGLGTNLCVKSWIPKSQIIDEMPKMEHIFYVDGGGNLAKGKKLRPQGYACAYYKNKGKAYTNLFNYITNNQAELKAVNLALNISIKRRFEDVVIYTDSANVVGWLTQHWKHNNKNIHVLVETTKKKMNKIKNLRIIKIDKKDNIGHVDL